MSDFAFSSERKNHIHLSRMRPISRSSLPSSSWIYCLKKIITHLDLLSIPQSDLFRLLKLHRFGVLESTLVFHVQLTDNGLLLQFALSSARHYLHACRPTSLHSCASLVSIFRRSQAACIGSVATSSSASVWASPLQPRPGLLRSWDGITSSAVRMMATANAASTSSRLLSLGGFTPRCLPTAVVTPCGSWGSVTRRLRSTGGLAEALNRRLRAK